MEEKFRELISSYLPDWQYEKSKDQPEAAILYAAQRLLEDSRQRMNRLPQKHEREFLKAWPLKPQKAEPMMVYAQMKAPIGEYVPTGSEMYLSGNGTRLWKTIQPVFAESLQLERQIMESKKLGKIIEIPKPSEKEPSSLFDFHSDGMQKNIARFYHKDAFRSKSGCRTELYFPNCDIKLLDCLTDPEKTQWMLERQDGSSAALKTPERAERTLKFILPAEPDSVALLAEIQSGTEVPTQTAGQVQVSAFREKQSYTTVIANLETVQEGSFYPFGHSLESWSTCYISCDDVLMLNGSDVTLDFNIAFSVTEEKLPGAQEQPKYRNIMFKMPPPPPQVLEVKAERVVWEYWNGSAWLPIPGTKQQTELFKNTDHNSDVQLHFHWPEDAQPCQIQGQDGHWLRWRITQVEGIGYLPRKVYIPEISSLSFSAVLNQDEVELSSRSGLDPDFLPIEKDKNSRLFSRRACEQDGWWLGFNHKPEGNILSLFLKFAERICSMHISVWEATEYGMKQLSVVDGTNGLANSGQMILKDIEGQQTEQFQQQGWWICIRNEDPSILYNYPKLQGVYTGAVCLQAEENDICQPEETVKSLRGGVMDGSTLAESFGGFAEEEDEDLLIRAEKYRHNLGRGVSAYDMEQLIQSTFPDVVRTRSHRYGDVVHVAVLMRDIHQHSAAFLHRKASITQLLKQKSAIPTYGLKISVREPTFYRIQTTIWICPKQDDDFQVDSENIRRTVERFLNPITGKFRGDGWRIGYLPTEKEMCNYLSTQHPDITFVKFLLTAITPQGQEIRCDQIKNVFALPVFSTAIVHEVQGEDIR